LSATKPPAFGSAGRISWIAAGGLAAVICFGGLSAASYAQANKAVDHTLEVMAAADDWLVTLYDIHTGARGFALSGARASLEPYERGLREERPLAARVRALVADNASQLRSVAEADRHALAVVTSSRELVEKGASGRRAEAEAWVASGESLRVIEAFRKDWRDLRVEEERLLFERRASMQFRALLTIVGAVVLVGASLLLLWLSWSVLRHRAEILERHAREARDRLRALSDVAIALSSARTREDVANEVVQEGMRIARADICTLYLSNDEETALELAADRGVAPDLLERIRRIERGTGNAAFESLEANRALWVENEAEYRALYPELASLDVEGRRARAFWSVPLVVEGKPLGLLGMGYYEPRHFSTDDRTLVRTLAQQCAQALLRTARLEREETARKREERERAQREFLAKAGEILVSSLDYEVTLAAIARLAVPAIADWCAVEIADAGASTFHLAAVAHVDLNKVKFAEELIRRYPTDPNARSGVPEVIRSGTPELYREIPSALLEAAARDAEHLRLIRELRLESGMVVPLCAHGRTHGAMTFVYAESGRRYTPEDLQFAEDFARRAAMAIENANALKKVEEGRETEHRLRAEAEVASHAKDEFLAMVSHELRTPLNAILGWAVMLRRKSPSAESDRALAVIERNANAQAKLIEDVLDMSRIISGKLTLNLAPTEVNDAVTRAVETVSPAADAKRIEIALDLVPELPAITADPDRVQQIVWNLLSNAVKFSPKNSTVSVRAHREGSEVLIEVRDRGEGIRRDALPHIFDAFQQADVSTTRRHGGLGLGLAIVKQLVSAHGGTVRAESEGEGKGALIVVRLPARSAVPALVERPRSAASGGSTGPLVTPRLDGLKVLVVDDEVDALGLAREALRDFGADVVTAGSVSEALTKFASQRPDVVVSDIGMPGEDGYSLLRKIRALSAAQGGRTPAIALTAYARADDARRAFAAGYQMHVAKPASPDQLSNVVAIVAGRSVRAV
jgi:signal transduction histidine kinase/CHASE3 domain sensor protein/ActR/RegA family two-component response regulator